MNYTRIREQGTLETVTNDNNEKIQAIRQIVESKQYSKVNGCMVDLFTASVIVRVYDALNDINKSKYINLSIPRMAEVGFKLLNH